jgi:hypothetical protein
LEFSLPKVPPSQSLNPHLNSVDRIKRANKHPG